MPTSVSRWKLHTVGEVMLPHMIVQVALVVDHVVVFLGTQSIVVWIFFKIN
jgi:hypothetical protein